MSEIIVCVGISGSGKTTYCNKHYPDFTILCMDDIRKELTGDISDQSKNKEVYQIYRERLDEALANNENICISNTNLKLKDCTLIPKIAPENYNITFLLFDDSLDWKTCENRVKKDLENNIERSNTDVLLNSGIPLIMSMSERYANTREALIDFTKNIPDIKIKFV